MASTLDPLSGHESFAAPPQKVLAILTDPAALAAAIPGLVSSEPGEGRSRRCVVRPAFSFLSGNIRLLLTVEPGPDANEVTVRTTVQGIGLSMDLQSCMTAAPTPDGGTRVEWQAQVVAMKGLLTAVPSGLIRAASDSVVRDGWAALHKRIESTPEAA